MKAGARSSEPRLAQHEAFLVRPDRRADRLGRDVEEGLVEGAHQHHRPFHEARHLVQQALVLHEVEAAGEGEVAGVVQDHVLAPLGVEDDLRALQGLDVVVEPAHLDRPRAPGSDGRRSRCRPRCRSTENGTTSGVSVSGPKVATIDCSGRTQRKAAGLRRGRAPAHGFRPGEGPDDLGQEFGQHVQGLAAGTLDHREVELALLRVGDGPRPGPGSSGRRPSGSPGRPPRGRRPAGPRRSSRTASPRAGRPAMCSASRRGVENALAPSYRKPRSTSASVTSFFRSSAARRCMRAGISSERSSSRRSGMARPYRRAAGLSRARMAPGLQCASPFRMAESCHLRSPIAWASDTFQVPSSRTRS